MPRTHESPKFEGGLWKEDEEEDALTLLPDEEDSVAAEVGAGEERG